MSTARASALLALATVAACGGAASSEDLGQSGSATSCAVGAVTEGVDVSRWQGTVDWAQVKKSGKAFAFIRVSDGLHYPDGELASNWAGAKAAGLLRGAYQYFEPSQDPAAQARLLVDSLHGDLGELPAVVDVEVADGQSPSAVRAALDTWSATVRQATGRVPVVYVSPGFWASVGGAAESDDLWVANWDAKCPELPPAWSSWRFWQYSDQGTVSGISGRVDLDRFDGSLADLEAYAHGAHDAGTGGLPDAGHPDAGRDAEPDASTGHDAAPEAGHDAGHEAAPPPAPTWTEITSTYLDQCSSCHSGTGTPSGLYDFLKGKGYVGGASPKLTSAGSCLSWYGGNMPPGGPTSDPAAVKAMDAWAAAGGLDD